MVSYDYKYGLVRLDLPNRLLFLDFYTGSINCISKDNIFSCERKFSPNVPREIYVRELERNYVGLMRTSYVYLKISFNELIYCLSLSREIAEFFTKCYYDQNLLSLKVN